MFDNKFNNKLGYEYLDKDSKQIVRVYLQAPTAEYAAGWLNKFIDYVNNETIKSIKKDISTNLDYRIKDLKRNIDEIRNVTKLKRLDSIQSMTESDELSEEKIQINIIALKNKAQMENSDKQVVLTEARGIAKNLNIKKPAFLTKLPGAQDAPEVMINIQGIPEYMKGVDAIDEELSALRKRNNNEAFINGIRDLEKQLYTVKKDPEINRLKTRENDDPYIPQLRDLLNKIHSLESIETNILNSTGISAVTVDTYARVPEQSIWPKRKMIVVLGIISGLLIGVCLSLLHNYMKHKE